MAYTKGNSSQIVVGAAALFTRNTDGTMAAADLPDFVSGEKYVETLSGDTSFTNVGYTSNGLELMFQPDFGEVKVDQVLDAAKLFKQGMKVELKTTFAEATLENLLVATAGKSSDLSGAIAGDGNALELNLVSGELGEYPIERGIVAVGASVQVDPVTGEALTTDTVERIYSAYRALSIQNVTVNAKRDAPSEFEVTFRLLPDDVGAYGKIVDHVVGSVSAS